MAETRAFDTLASVRTWMLLLLIGGMVGAGVELALLGHMEEWTQVIPLVLLGLGIALASIIAVRPSRRVLQAFRGLMVGFGLAGVVGLVLHVRGNIEFELEMRPAMRGLELWWNALTGATPALAPGSMLLLAGIGILYTYRHPSLRAAGGMEGVDATPVDENT